MLSTTTHTNNSSLAQFILRRYEEWDENFNRILKAKLQANLDAMNRVDSNTFRKFKAGEGEGWRSDVYIPVSRTKVMAFHSMLCDILIKDDLYPFTLKPSPYANELIEGDEDTRKAWEKSRDIMRDRIEEQLRQYKAVREKKKKIMSLCVYARAWSKFDPVNVKSIEWTRRVFGPEWIGQAQVAAFERVVKWDKVPGHRYVSVWNVRWDMENENIQTGNGIAERDFCSVYDLRENIGEPLFIEHFIEKVIDDQKGKNLQIKDVDSIEPGLREVTNRKKAIQRIEFWGRAPRKLVEEFEEKLGRIRAEKGKRSYLTLDAEDFDMRTYNDNEEESGDDVEIMAQVVGEEIVRFARRDREERPYHTTVAETTLDGMVATAFMDSLESTQYVANGLWRAFLDNARLQANVILAIKRRFLADPSKADKPITPGTKLDVSESCDDARKAMAQVTIQDITGALLNGIGINDRHADRFSMMPEILQGSTLPKQKPDTAYELSQLQENGTRYAGAIIRQDDEMTVDEIKDMLDWNMGDETMDERGKGNYLVFSGGFQTFRKQVIQLSALKQLLALALTNPMLLQEIKLKTHLEVIYESSEFDPDDFLKSEEEKATEAKAAAAVQAEAAANAQKAAEAETQGKIQSDLAKTQAKGQADIQKEALKGQTAKERDEEQFQRDIIKKGLESQAVSGEIANQ